MNHNSNPIFISLEGGISAGKTTLLSHIKTRFPQFNIVDEPVDSWLSLTDSNNTSLLSLFYNNKSRWSYTFQNCAFITRFTGMMSSIENWKNSNDPATSKSNVFITERSVLTDRYVFAEMLRDTGDLNKLEWELYCKWFDFFVKDLPIKGIVHITTDSKTCADRIKIRNRKGEESIPLEYLDDLDTYHKKWLANTNIPVLEITSNVKELDKLEEFINSLNQK